MKLFGTIFLLLASFVFVLAQERVITGTVTDSNDGTPLPGVNVLLKDTNLGVVTDADGKYRISVPSEGGVLQFSFIGFATQEVSIGSRSTVDVGMSADVTELNEIVVTALGVSRETKTLPYAAQQVSSENINMTQNVDVKGALAGKVAGVQINGQAGSKLGNFGKIRIRGSISLTGDSEPLYVLDGVPVGNPNDIDVNNIESINVLKGPTATALYGQRADAGVVILTSKKGMRNSGLSVELISSTTFEKVGYLPKMQDLYGGGYEGEDSWGTFDKDAMTYPDAWDVFDGQRYLLWDNNYADESWGPKFDGQDYVPWYAWWPDSPYFGQTAKYSAQPDNIKSFYDTGVSAKNTIAITGGGDNYNLRVAYTHLDQNGITPYTDFSKDYLLTNLNFNATEKLSFATNVRFASQEITGDYGDGYGNQTSGSFNSWFSRGTEMDKMKELKDLTTFDGYSASWNWWGPDFYSYYGGGFKKAAFWFNPYTYLERFEQRRNNTNLSGSLTAKYEFTDDLSLEAVIQRDQDEYKFEYYLPFFLANSAAPELYNSWSNSFGKYRRSTSENNYATNLRYRKQFTNFDVTALVGGNLRIDKYANLSAQMPTGAKTGGLIIPDVYTFSNAGIPPVPTTFEYTKKVNSVYGNVSVGYNGIFFLDGSYRRDWSSALPADINGYSYGSIGGSLIVSEFLTDQDFVSFAKVRGSYGIVGSDVGALQTKQVYGTASQAFEGDKIIMSTPNTLINPALKSPSNSAYEFGADVRVMENRIGLSVTYYNETRKDDIIPVSIASSTGYTSFLTNAGESVRKGLEFTLDGDILKSAGGLSWNAAVNFAKNTTTVVSLPSGLNAITAGLGTGSFSFITVRHQLDNQWGQLRGTGIARDDAGNPIIQGNGRYLTVNDQYFGSILPDFVGGFINRFNYMGIDLVVSIDYQKGGKFFSLTEQWGQYSGLLEETAATNDKGVNVREDTGDDGGVHVTGVDSGGSPVDTYVNALTYFGQFYGNRLAEPFVHDASYIKLREIAISYDLAPLLKINALKAVRLGVVGRDLGLLAVSEDNVHRWDPSILSQAYGENGQLPGTRSYGFNLNVTF